MPRIDDIPEQNTEITVTGNRSLTLTLPVEFIDQTSALKEVVSEDVQHLNNSLKGLYAAWGQVKTISNICKLATATADIVERRRKLLCKPANFNEYHNSQSGDNKVYGYETLD